MTVEYLPEELESWWPALCPECGWRGLSRDCAGGGPIADTGDFNDPECPKCWDQGLAIPVIDDEDFKTKSI